MLQTTVGQLLVNQALPPELRDYKRTLDGKAVRALFQQIAEKYPENYKDLAKKLSDVGRELAYSTGGFTFGAAHLAPAKVHQQVRAQIAAAVDSINESNASDDDKAKQIILELGKHQKSLEDAIYQEARESHNPLADQILSGSRGKPGNLKSLIGSDIMYRDHRDRMIPVPILRGYAQGLTPAEYFAGAFGARQGVIAVKMSTGEAGFFGKQLTQAAHRLLVTRDDDDADEKHRRRGLPVDTDDPDNEGALLSFPAGGYPRNTALTPKVLADLRDQGVKRLVVRSPIVGGPEEGGLYGRDVGFRERGRIAPVGDQVGNAAAAAISEPVSQGGLCLAAGTMVRMADWSTRPIESVQVGEMVLGSDVTGKTFPVRVLNRFDNGARECVRTVFKVGQSRERVELLSTPEHKLLATVAKYPFAKEDYVLGVYPVATKTRYFSPMMTKSAAFHDGPFANREGVCPFLLGLLLGDGCYTDSVNGVHLCCHDPSLIEYLDKSAWILGNELKLTKLKGHKGYYRISQIKDKTAFDSLGRYAPGSRNPLRLYLERAGMWGKYAHEKCLPDSVWEWRTGDVAQVLAGLYVTDGSVYVLANQKNASKCYINFCSTSKKLIEQVKGLLDYRFSIHASRIYEGRYGAQKRPAYSLNLTTQVSIKKFAREVHLEGIKKITLAHALAGWKIPHEVDSDKFHRKEQEPVGPLPTYDIEVDHPDHLFVLANGLIVSNSEKHSGGVAGAGRVAGGFKMLDMLVQVPKTFTGGAAHSDETGTVQTIVDAPAGGKYIRINGKDHYVPPGATITAQPGQEVEAGDILSDGLPNPSKVVQHKGIGEGRRYFAKTFLDALKANNISAHRRNVEILSRGLIDHVRMTDELGDRSPDDVVSYDRLEKEWQPRAGFASARPSSSIGKYLETPVLHYTIGTKISKSMLPLFQEAGIDSVDVHPDPPPFQPEMIRGMDILQYDPDWMTRQLGSNLKKSFLKGVHTAASSDPLGTSYVPALANPVDFGRKGLVKGFEVEKSPKPGQSALAGLGD